MEMNESKSIEELEAAAEAGDDEAKFLLGKRLYEEGKRREQSNGTDEGYRDRAIKCLKSVVGIFCKDKEIKEKAAMTLANIYEGEKEFREAFDCYTIAAQCGNLFALYKLGIFCTLGIEDEIKKDLAYGFCLLERAFKKGEECAGRFFAAYFADDKYPSQTQDFEYMCGSAYSLLKFQHCEDEAVCQRATRIIEELPADGRQKLQAFWDAFKHIAKDGELFRDKKITIFLNWRPELAGKSLDISAVSAVVSDVQYPAMREWIPKAEAGDAEACYKLAEYILAEQQCDNRYRELIEWIEDGNYRHDGEALKWYLLAARQGHGMAQWQLAMDLYSAASSGWDIDYENVFFWSVKGSQNKELSDKRRLDLLSEVGYLYVDGPWSSGYGAEQDLDYGYSLIRRALSNGSNDWFYLLDNFSGKKVWYDHFAFIQMCGGAYSLLVLSNSKDESVREKAKAEIAKLPEERQQLLYRFWDEFKKQTEDGKLFRDGEITIFLRKQAKLLESGEQDISSVAKLITTKKETLGDYMTVDEMMQRICDLEEYTKSMGEDAPLWLKMLADNGDAFCQYVLGKWFAESPEFGEPCRSFMKARHWLTLAAEQGYLAAKEDLIKLRKDYSQHDSDEKEA